MAIGDKVKIGMGSIDISPESVMVYDIRRNNDGTAMLDHNGAVTLVRKGGVKGGSTGTIVDHPIKTAKSQLQSHDRTASLGGDEYVNVYPVMLDYYKQLGFFPQDHVHMTSGPLTSYE